MKDVMLDLETMGYAPRGAIVSIGAVLFDLKAGIHDQGNTFYQTVSLESSVSAGGRISAGTVVWWLQQSAEARGEIIGAVVSIGTALEEFAAWFPKKARIWGNGASFDCTILRAAYEALGYKVPWHYRQERDVRTLVGMFMDLHDAGDNNPDQKSRLTAGGGHNALRDALRQVEYCTQMYQCFVGSVDAEKRLEALYENGTILRHG